jgi:hypothetical protein
MLANPAKKFHRPIQMSPTDALAAKPHERRSICVLPKGIADQLERRGVSTKCSSGRHTHMTRSKVTAQVASGEMHWIDLHHNTATYTVKAGATWQNTCSGTVHTMQPVSGRKGRYVPLTQQA